MIKRSAPERIGRACRSSDGNRMNKSETAAGAAPAGLLAPQENKRGALIVHACTPCSPRDRDLWTQHSFGLSRFLQSGNWHLNAATATRAMTALIYNADVERYRFLTRYRHTVRRDAAAEERAPPSQPLATS